ncbi:MAG: hypothetical protein IH586_00160 [Anaerolineaceae bacterium]|nr:hypothetical protein [Anaerolineaceae bacterium]
MENNTLTPQQRENIKNQLIRRLGKLDDAALIQLENLTRHPQQIGSQMPASPGGSQASAPNPPAAGRSQPAERQSKFNRREALGYGLSGLFALAAAAAGYEWYMSDSEYQMLRDQVAQAETEDITPAVRATVEKFGADLEGLAKLAQETAQKKISTIQVMETYKDSLAPAALSAMARLQKVTNQVETKQNAPYVLEAVDTLLAMLENKELRYFYDFLKAYQEVLPALTSFLRAIPPLITTNKKAVSAITPWITNEKSVTGEVFEPLETDLFPTLDTLAQQADAIQTAYQSTLAVEIMRLLDERDKVNQFVAEQ